MPRMSVRLRHLKTDSPLRRAMCKKARLREGDSSALGLKARKWTTKRVTSKSLLCRVSLTDGEATELHGFICADM